MAQTAWVLGNHPLAGELKLLRDWFYENWPITREDKPQPRIIFKLRETNTEKEGWDGVLSWGNGEISRDIRITCPKKMMDTPGVLEATKATFIADIQNTIMADMRRWGSAPKPVPTLEILPGQKVIEAS